MVGPGKRHQNVSDAANRHREISIRIRVFTANPDLSRLPPQGTVQEPELLAINSPVLKGVKCLVDTGAPYSMFRGAIARRLGLDVNDSQMELRPMLDFAGRRLRCLRCKHVVYLEIGPYAIPVSVQFPVQPASIDAPAQYKWIEDFPPENFLGMESILDKRLLCFTPDCLYAFEKRL
jgi:hypothetical protein